MNTFFWWGPFWIPFIAVGVVVWIVVGFFFLLNLRDLLLQVNPQYRAMQPNQVWLNFIPIFNIFWMFFTIVRVRDSVQREYQARNWAPKGDFGFGVGLAAAILTILNWGPLGLAGLICWIIYWSKEADLKNQLVQYGPYEAVVPGAPTPPTSGASAAAPGPTQAGSNTDTGAPSPAQSSPGQQASSAGGAAGSGAMSASCPYCGAPYREGVKFCSSCGRPAV